MIEPDDKKQFAEILRATLDIYGKDISVPVMQLWWAALIEFSIEEVRGGLSRYVRSADHGTFPPKPADVIRMIEGSSGDRGMIAWAKVREAVARVGGYQSVAFDDSIIHAVIEDMGGWPQLCSMDKDEQHFRAADFSKRYRTYAERGGPERFEPYLTGRHESGNRMHGHKAADPVLIGDPEKVVEVMALGNDAPRLQITRATGMYSLADMVTKAITGPKSQ